MQTKTRQRKCEEEVHSLYSQKTQQEFGPGGVMGFEQARGSGLSGGISSDVVELNPLQKVRNLRKILEREENTGKIGRETKENQSQLGQCHVMFVNVIYFLCSPLNSGPPPATVRPDAALTRALLTNKAVLAGQPLDMQRASPSCGEQMHKRPAAHQQVPIV